MCYFVSQLLISEFAFLKFIHFKQEPDVLRNHVYEWILHFNNRKCIKCTIELSEIKYANFLMLVAM
jgi:hypothetical protein